LPHLRLAGDVQREHLSEAGARRVVHGSGIVGGTPGNPGRAREWAPRLADREAQLRELLAWLEPDEPGEDEPEKARHALGRRDAEKLLAMIVAVRPAVEALTDLAGAVLDDTPLPELWPRIRDFVREWCRVPPGPPDAAKLLDETIADVCAIGAAQQWVDGTDRELAGLMLETAVALGRPDPVTGAAEAVPSLGSLRRLYVGPGNEARLAADRARPATARAALRMVAALGDGARRPVAPGWVAPADGLLSLARLRAIEAERESNDYLRSDGLL